MSRVVAATAAALMLWSVIAAPEAVTQGEPISEPEDLTGYATFADAAPVQLFVDHQARLVPLGPAIAHAQSEVSLPSAAAAISWLVNGGVANGVHGTTTGAKVPTEASAQQPGGDTEQEFLVAGGPIGDPSFMTVRAGRASATATRAGDPRGYGNAFLKEIAVLPAAGSPPDTPGTFDPEASFPGGEPDETDPAPRGRMAILSIGKISSSSESIREGSTVTSIAVAELSEINMGNRTADNRCTNCIRIDKIRVEAFAEANAQTGGSQGAYRVTLGRACRRGFNAETGAEEDRCLPLDPHDPSGAKGLQSIDELSQVNDLFEEPLWTRIPGSGVDYMIGIRISAGGEHQEPARSQRTAAPPDDPRRNYAYPDTRPKDPENPDEGHVAPDRDDGQVARAVAEGPDIEIWTITVSQIADDANRRIEGTPIEDALIALDEDDETPGLQVTAPGPARDAFGTQSIPVDTIRQVRRLHLTLGVARAGATARPAAELSADLDADGGAPSAGIAPLAPAPPVPGGGAGASAGMPGAAGGLTGPFSVRVDWASFRIKPWAPDDMVKGFGSAAVLIGALWLLRRRLWPSG